MTARQVRRRKGRARQEKLNGFALDRRVEGGRIGRKLRGLLALSEVRAGRVALILVEEVVDEVWGERDQVRDKEAGRQAGQRRQAPGPPGPSEHVAHCGVMLPDSVSGMARQGFPGGGLALDDVAVHREARKRTA
jgi:hypothetical protein